MTRILPVATGVVAVLVCGLVHGSWTGRWGVGGELAEAAARLEQVPAVLDDWESRDLDLDQRQLGPISGYLHRQYLNRRTGDAVSLFMVCGRSGPISIHTPDVCYGASGFDVTAPEKFTAAGTGSAAEFWTVRLHKQKATEQTHLRIFWSWNATGAWTAADNPRLIFARRPFLYKLYLLREMAAPDEPLEDDPCVGFMRLLLPELRRTLFPET